MATLEIPRRLIPRAQQSDREVIDVDSLDEDAVLRVERSLPPLNDTGPINNSNRTGAAAGSSFASAIVVESDEEEAPRVDTTHVQRRLLSPPPRPVHPRYVPPVPPIPHHLAGNSAFPAHLGRRGPGAPPPVILPNARPFPFEAYIHQPPPRRHTPPLDALPPAPAARSHHQPVMGLGGALIALNRRSVMEEAIRRHEAQERMLRQERGWRSYLPAFLDIWRDDESQLGMQRHAPAQADMFPGAIVFNGPIDDIEDLELLRDVMDNPFGGGGLREGIPPPARPKEQHYKPSYTHPEKPMPGFTFDFAPPETPSTSATASPIIVLDDDETIAGPSRASRSLGAVEAPATLVCTRCNDPLTLSAESAAAEEELVSRKIWALRCGHMLDGKCIQELMKPPAPPPLAVPLDPPQVLHDPKGKGKGKARDVLCADIVTDVGDPHPHLPELNNARGRTTGKEPSTSRKGKRKAAEMLQPEYRTDGQSPDSVEAPPEDNSIRSRLRPRHPRPPSVSLAPVAEPVTVGVPLPPFPPPPVRALPRRRRHGPSATRRKGKGKAKSTIEAVLEWACPVTGCGHVHASICVDGKWKMDLERGAIGLFI